MRRPAGVAGNQIFAPAAAGAAGSPHGWLAGLLAGRLGQTARVLRGHVGAGQALAGRSSGWLEAMKRTRRLASTWPSGSPLDLLSARPTRYIHGPARRFDFCPHTYNAPRCRNAWIAARLTGSSVTGRINHYPTVASRLFVNATSSRLAKAATPS